MNSVTFKFQFLFALFVFSSYLNASDDRLFDCNSIFRSDLTHDMLVAKLGDSNVSIEDIHIRHGNYEKGTILYANTPDLKVEIRWKNDKDKANPKVIKITGKRSYWKTVEGITLGNDLLELEKINGSPFILMGFGWDESGTVVSWEKGSLVSTDTAECSLRVRMYPSREKKNTHSESYQEVIGGIEFSSENLAMKDLNPRVNNMFLIYK